jgi:hypothetical protein
MTMPLQKVRSVDGRADDGTVFTIVEYVKVIDVGTMLPGPRQSPGVLPVFRTATGLDVNKVGADVYEVLTPSGKVVVRT